ncbi:hypothetical protein CsatA_006956 [Cannabis sativa]
MFAATSSTRNDSGTDKFQWNGITSKKKGQQWGKEKTDFHKRNDLKKENPECSDMLVNEEEEKEDQEKTTVDVPIDFDKLKPCSTLPQNDSFFAIMQHR